MVYLTVLLLLSLSAVIAMIMVRDALLGRIAIFSVRNIFLFGILLFQSVSASISLLADDFGQVYLQRAGVTSLVFTGLLTLFLFIFLYSYGKGPFVVRWANRDSTTHDATEGGLLVCAFAAVVAGLVLRFVLGPIPILGVLSLQFAAGSFAVACGLAGWAWGRRPANFAIVAAAVVVVLVCIASLLAYSFGRREVLGVLLTFIWALFYSRWRHSGVPLLLVRTAVFGSIGLAFLVFFTAARRGDETRRTAAEYFVAFTQVSAAEITESTFALTNGQQAGSNSMWLIETHPEDFPYDTLHSLAYYFTQPVPRAIWEAKYEPLGREMVKDARITRVAQEYSVGPGIVGHVVNDNPWIALPLYAALLGLALRFIDERVKKCIEDPFIVVPLGAGLAQILGMPRGELGLFAFQLTTAIVGGWLVLRVVGPLVWWRIEPGHDGGGEEGDVHDEDHSDESHAGDHGELRTHART